MLLTAGFPLLVALITYQAQYSRAQLPESAIDKKIKDLFGEPPANVAVRRPTATPIPSVDIPGCECVPYYLCNGTTMNTNGEGIIDIRNNDNNCVSYMERCCLPPDIRRGKIIPDPKILPTGCGYRRTTGVGMEIIGDEDGEAKFGEFPWMVAILREEVIDMQILNTYHCGGSLIHPKAVITAAHCVSNRERQYKIRAGEWDAQTRHEILEHQDRKVKSIIVHPDFYRGALYNDIALLILETPVKLDQHISVACLPRQGAVIPGGTECLASGWGKDLFGAEGEYSVILKKRDLPIAARNKCQSSLRTTRLGRYFLLHESFVCAGGIRGKDTCQGDGGSPLVCPIPGQTDRYQQAGIVAWGIGCGEDGIPGVYANVALFRNWVDDEMSKHNLDITQYQY